MLRSRGVFGPRPLISVIMPVHNGAGTIRAAVASTLKDLPDEAELIVHDDGSEDATRAVLDGIQDRRLRVVGCETSLGVAQALNRLIEESRGIYIARMDADDLTLPGRFARQIAAAQRGVDLVFTSRINFGSSLSSFRPAPLSPVSPDAMRLRLVLENPVPHSSLLARGDILRSSCRYVPGPAEDYQLWMQLVAQGARATRLAVPGIAYRSHPLQVTRTSLWRQEFLGDPSLRQAHCLLLNALGWPTAEGWDLVFRRSQQSPQRRAALREFLLDRSRELRRAERSSFRLALARALGY